MMPNDTHMWIAYDAKCTYLPNGYDAFRFISQDFKTNEISNFALKAISRLNTLTWQSDAVKSVLQITD